MIPEADGRQLLSLIEALRASLGATFWLLLVPVVVAFLDLLLASALAIRALLARVPSGARPEAPRWNGIDILVVWLFWMFVSLGLGQLVGLGATTLNGSESTHNALVYTTVTLVGFLSCAMALLMPRLLHRQGPGTLGVRAPVGKGVAVGALMYLAFLPGAIGVLGLWDLGLLLLGVPLSPQTTVVTFQRAFAGGEISVVLPILVFGVVVAPLFEELLYRALLFGWLREQMSPRAAVLISAVVFGAIHFNLLALVPVTVLGVVLALVYHRTNNLWCCITLHALFNAVQFVVMMVSL